MTSHPYLTSVLERCVNASVPMNPNVHTPWFEFGLQWAEQAPHSDGIERSFLPIYSGTKPCVCICEQRSWTTQVCGHCSIFTHVTEAGKPPVRPCQLWAGEGCSRGLVYHVNAAHPLFMCNFRTKDMVHSRCDDNPFLIQHPSKPIMAGTIDASFPLAEGIA